MTTATFQFRRLEHLRLRRGLTQADVAYELRRRHGLKTDQAQIARWEGGQHTPRAGAIPALADVLGCRMDDLYGDDDEEADERMPPAFSRALDALAQHHEYGLAHDLRREIVRLTEVHRVEA